LLESVRLSLFFLLPTVRQFPFGYQIHYTYRKAEYVFFVLDISLSRQTDKETDSPLFKKQHG